VTATGGGPGSGAGGADRGPEPDAAHSARERASTLIKLGRHHEAAATARAALRADPDDPGLTLLLAVALCETGDTAEAHAVAERAVALRPDSAIAHRTLGWTIYKRGRHNEAIEHLAHALSLDPHDSEAHIMRAEALLKLAQRSRLLGGRRKALIAEADRHATEAVELEPTAASGYLMHGKACVARSDAAGAGAWAQKALALEPDHPVGHQLLGLAAQISGDTRAAADHYLDAGKLNPRSGASMKMLKSLRTSLPMSGLAFFILARIVLALGQLVGGVVLVLALLVLAGLFLYRVFGSRWHARRTMSIEARMALARERDLRRRWAAPRPWLRLRSWFDGRGHPASRVASRAPSGRPGRSIAE
jgi:tetratricopeptide (TPR) repeat protein